MRHLPAMAAALALTGVMTSTLAQAPAQSVKSAPTDQGQAKISSVSAGLLTQALAKAKLVDPLYRAGLAEFDSNLQTAKVAGAAYYPQLKLATGQTDSDAGARRTSVSLIQPIWSAARTATKKEYQPRIEIADASLALREVDLAKRLFTVLSEILSARESLVQNRALVDALVQEKRAAQILLDRGHGTITDVRDAEVKVLQANGEALRLEGQLDAAQGKLYSMVGERLAVPALAMQSDGFKVALDGPAQPAVNPELVLAQQQEVLAQLEADKARSAWMPEVNFAYTRTDVGGQSSSYSGVALALPLEAGKFYDQYAIQAKALQAQEERRDKERSVALEVDRLKAMLKYGLSEVPIRLAAVRAAELSVIANQKSFGGGVKTIMDVLNSIQTVYSVKTEYVKALLALADNLFQLRTQQGYDGAQGLSEVQTLLFAP